MRTTAGIGTGSNCSALACTTTGYDSLNRVTSVTTPDGLAAQAGYTGNTASVTDQAQTIRSYTMDGLGRLTQVVENPGSAQVATTYCYDLLDNLAAVYQPLATTCQPSGYAGQVRTFNFDSLSRLEATTQPEGGATAFAYDPNGNLVWRQDSRGVETCTSFDGLNRPSARVYYEGSVAGGQTGQCGSIPSSAYDPQTTPVSYAYGTSGNGTGQLISVSNGVSVTQFTNFDALGRVLNSIQGTAGATYPFGYAYNLAGSLTNEGYPSGRGIAYAYDALDRPTQVSGTAAGQQAVSYMSGIAYAPQSAPQSYTYGNQLARSYTYNVRLQPQEMTDTAGGAALLDLQFGWDGGTATTHNNGSLRTQQIGTNAGTFAEGFGYDALNRLTSVTDNGGGANQRNYAYDAYGNAAVSGNTGTFPLSPLTPGAGTTFTNNQLPSSLATYDAAGNAIGLGSCTNCLAYDGENRQVAAALNGGTTTYGYDGAGNRVLKTAADGTATVYVYDALNQMIAEYTSAATPPTAPCQTCYVSWDQLGSTRLVTDAGGNVIARHDYLPFGEEIGAGNAGRPSGWGALDAVDQKFTGQERDDESHLDFFQARYYGSAQARFNSPDPMNAGADLYNPQSWNGYAYVMNSPLSAVDPDGLQSQSTGPSGCSSSPSLCMGGGASGTPGQNGGSSGFGFSFGWSFGGAPSRVVTLSHSVNRSSPDSELFDGVGADQPILTKSDLNPFNDEPPLAFQGFVNLFLNGQIVRGGTQLILGLLPSAAASFSAARFGAAPLFQGYEAAERAALAARGFSSATVFRANQGLLNGETSGLTNHALSQIFARGVTSQDIAEALTHVPKGTNGSVLRFIGEGAEVRVNRITGRIVTVIRFSAPDAH